MLTLTVIYLVCMFTTTRVANLHLERNFTNLREHGWLLQSLFGNQTGLSTFNGTRFFGKARVWRHYKSSKLLEQKKTQHDNKKNIRFLWENQRPEQKEIKRVKRERKKLKLTMKNALFLTIFKLFIFFHKLFS